MVVGPIDLLQKLPENWGYSLDGPGIKAANSPQTVDSEDVMSAHAQGGSDREIFDVVALVATNRPFTSMLKMLNVASRGRGHKVREMVVVASCILGGGSCLIRPGTKGG